MEPSRTRAGEPPTPPPDDEPLAPPPLAVPHVDPIGVVHYPAGFQPASRPRRPAFRLAAALVLAVFTLVVVATTVASLGRYCLTSDGDDLRWLPRSSSPPSETPSETPPPERR